MYRPPYVAGSFYPGDKSALKKMIEKFMEEAKKNIDFFDEGKYIFVRSCIFYGAGCI